MTGLWMADPCRAVGQHRGAQISAAILWSPRPEPRHPFYCADFAVLVECGRVPAHNAWPMQSSSGPCFSSFLAWMPGAIHEDVAPVTGKVNALTIRRAVKKNRHRHSAN